MATAEDLEAKLTCSVCLQLFQEPRILPCGHTYCHHCLNSYIASRAPANNPRGQQGFLCPVCRDFILAPDRLTPPHLWAFKFKPNYLIRDIVEVHGKNKQRGVPRPACPRHPNKLLELYCRDCRTSVCDRCVALHHRKCEEVLELAEVSRETQQAARKHQQTVTRLLKQLEAKKRRCTTGRRELERIERDMDAKIEREGQELLRRVADFLRSRKETLKRQAHAHCRQCVNVVNAYTEKCDELTGALRALDRVLSQKLRPDRPHSKALNAQEDEKLTGMVGKLEVAVQQLDSPCHFTVRLIMDDSALTAILHTLQLGEIRTGEHVEAALETSGGVSGPPAAAASSSSPASSSSSFSSSSSEVAPHQHPPGGCHVGPGGGAAAVVAGGGVGVGVGGGGCYKSVGGGSSQIASLGFHNGVSALAGGGGGPQGGGGGVGGGGSSSPVAAGGGCFLNTPSSSSSSSSSVLPNSRPSSFAAPVFPACSPAPSSPHSPQSFLAVPPAHSPSPSFSSLSSLSLTPVPSPSPACPHLTPPAPALASFRGRLLAAQHCDSVGGSNPGALAPAEVPTGGVAQAYGGQQAQGHNGQLTHSGQQAHSVQQAHSGKQTHNGQHTHNVQQAHNGQQAHNNGQQAHNNGQQAHNNGQQAHNNGQQAHNNVQQAHNGQQAHNNVQQAHNGQHAHNGQQAHNNGQQAHNGQHTHNSQPAHGGPEAPVQAPAQAQIHYLKPPPRQRGHRRKSQSRNPFDFMD